MYIFALKQDKIIQILLLFEISVSECCEVTKFKQFWSSKVAHTRKFPEKNDKDSIQSNWIQVVNKHFQMNSYICSNQHYETYQKRINVQKESK